MMHFSHKLQQILACLPEIHNALLQDPDPCPKGTVFSLLCVIIHLKPEPCDALYFHINYVSVQ